MDPKKSSPTVPFPAPLHRQRASASSPPAGEATPTSEATPRPAPAAAEEAGAAPDPPAGLFGPWSAGATREASAHAPTLPSDGAASPRGEKPVVGDWKNAPRPARVTLAGTADATAAEPEAPVVIPPPLDAVSPPDPAKEAARNSPDARRGLGTKRQLYHRLATTRQLINAWKRTGRYLAHPDRRLTRLAEANDLIQEFADIQELLKQFPPLMGEAGQPGYLVLALTKQPSVVPLFRGLSEDQREALARDWNAALDVLMQHRDFLREEVRSLRKKSRLARVIRATRAFCSDHSLSFLICAGVLALLVGIWTYYRYRPY